MIGKLVLRGLAAHRLRLALTAVAVLLGVSFVSGTLIFKDSVTRSFDDLFSRAYDGVQVIVRAEQSFAATEDGLDPPVPESLLATVRERVPAALDVQGAVEGYAAIVGRDGKVIGSQWTSQLGGDWVDHPASPLQIVAGQPPRAADEVVVDSATAESGRLRPGDRITILTQRGTQIMRLSGIFTFGPLNALNGLATYAAFPPQIAQRLLVKPGHYTTILVEARPGVPVEQLRAQVAAVLPAGYEAVTAAQEIAEGQAEIKQFLDVLGVFLLVFAGVSIFVGSFLIFNTFSMLVAQRTRELALLRAIGASRRQVTRSVLGEAVGTGLVGATLGLAVGAGLAVGLRELFGLFGVDLPASGLALSGATVAWSYLVGLAVTVVAAYLPARRAARTPPVVAMRADPALPARSMRLRLVLGTVLSGFGAVALAGGLAGSRDAAADADRAGLVALSAAVVVLGVVLLSPVLGRPVAGFLGWPLTRFAGTVGRLSRENARRNPRRTAATAAALMIGLALVAMVSVLAQSMKSSVAQAFDRGFGADYTLQASGLSGFSPAATQAVSQAPGVRAVTPVWFGAIRVAGEKLPVLVADPPTLADPLTLRVDSGTGVLGPEELLVQRRTAAELGWRVGSTVPGEYPDGTAVAFRIAGTFADNQLASSPFLIAPASYRPHAPTELINLAYVDADGDESTRRAVEAALAPYPNVQLQDRDATKAQARTEVDQLLAVIIVLLALSILIAALGIVNTLALSVLERTREIGLLRAVGMSRRQLRRMVRYESVVIAVFGAALGLALGVAFGCALQRALARQGVDVLSVPVGQLVGYAAAAVVIGIVAAIWPARRAARMDVLRAIATE
jgi:ABC-type antimicrobial peptide transport system permease subunit